MNAAAVAAKNVFYITLDQLKYVFSADSGSSLCSFHTYIFLSFSFCVCLNAVAHADCLINVRKSLYSLSLSLPPSLSRSITSFILSRRRRRQRSGISENIFSIKMLPSKLAISSSMFYLLLFTFSPFLLQNDRLDLTKNKHKERNRWLSKSGQMLPYLLTYLPKCRYKTFRKLGRVFFIFS